MSEDCRVLGIVGADGNKWTPAGEERAREEIRRLIVAFDPELVVSGECPKGGVDKFAREEAIKSGIPFRGFQPASDDWNGYKARNIQIAEISDMCCNITVTRYKSGKSAGYCYHCDETDTHVKSGGCWTMMRAVKLGKGAGRTDLDP